MSAAIDLETVVEIDRPAADAWAVVADYGQDPHWRQGVETMAPSHPGTVTTDLTTDEVLHLGGRTYRNHGEVVSVEDGRCFAWRTTHGADAHGRREVEPLGEDRCRVRLELHVVPHGSQRLLTPVLRRMLARNLAGDGERLVALLSGAPVEV